MTYREFYTAVINAELSEEMTEFATAAIKKLDDKNANRKSTTGNPKKAENEKFKERIYEDMNAEPNRIFTAKELSTLYTTDENEVTTQKISALLRQMAESGIVKVLEVKDSKKNKVKGYQII